MSITVKYVNNNNNNNNTLNIIVYEQQYVTKWIFNKKFILLE